MMLVAVLGYHDGAAGQVSTWLKYQIAAYVHEAESFYVDPEAENRKRVSQRTEYPFGRTFRGKPFIVGFDWPERLKAMGVTHILPLTPDNRERLRLMNRGREYGLALASAIHPSALVLPGAILEPGVWINARCVIGYKAEIAAGVILNTGVQVDHHNVLETCCQLDPRVTTAGNVTIRECAQIHTGATIINRIEVGQDAIVGAGAVVIDNVPPRCTTVGVPARVIKYH